MATTTNPIRLLTRLEIHLFGSNEPIEVEDTEDNDMATRMLNEFKNYGTMHLKVPAEEGQPSTVESFPYHTVKYIKTTQDFVAIYPDPYGCEPPTEQG